MGRWGRQSLAQYRHGKPDKLNIGGGQSWVGAYEGDRLVHAGGEHPATQEYESGELGPRVGREKCERLRAVHGECAGQVILQIRTNPDQLVARLDTGSAKLLGIADA